MTQSTRSAPLSAFGRRGAVATGHPLAAWTAFDVLSRGGSAVDAAIAADALLGVVEPMATGIGGDVLAIVVEPDGTAVTYNGTGRSPAGLTRAAMETVGLDAIPERSPWSVTVPGAVRGWFDLLARWGRLPVAELLAPAVRTARQGFPVGPIVAREWLKFQPVLRRHAGAAALYGAETPPAAGGRFANPHLADLLERIGAEGPDAFYRGEPAFAAAGEIRDLGGWLSEEDFAAHAGFFAEPLVRRLGDVEVLQTPPNTCGVAVLDALEELDGRDFAPDDPAAAVAMAQAVRGALAKARDTVADPGNTVATVVADGEGRVVTLMSSVFKRFGSGIAVAGGGFVLQNRAHGFAGFGHPNEPGPSKRPYHTVIPGAARRDGKPWCGIGVVGGDMQSQGQVQVLARLMRWTGDPQAALDAPRFRWSAPMKLAVEETMPEMVRAALAAAGFEIAVGNADFGGGQVVLAAGDGWAAGSDRRKDGIPLAW